MVHGGARLLDGAPPKLGKHAQVFIEKHGGKVSCALCPACCPSRASCQCASSQLPVIIHPLGFCAVRALFRCSLTASHACLDSSRFPSLDPTSPARARCCPSLLGVQLALDCPHLPSPPPPCRPLLQVLLGERAEAITDYSTTLKSGKMLSADLVIRATGMTVRNCPAPCVVVLEPSREAAVCCCTSVACRVPTQPTPLCLWDPRAGRPV